MFFEVTPPRRNVKKKQTVEEDVSVLTLAPFSPVPKIAFNNILIGSTAIQKLCIKNPSACITDISITKIPKTDNNEVILNWTETDIAACGSRVLEIKWCPKEPGVWRDILRIFNKRSKLNHDIYIVFRAVTPVKKISPQKQRGRLVNSRPNFIATKIRKIYSNSTKGRPSLSPKKKRKSLSPKTKQVSKIKASLKENQSLLAKKSTGSNNVELKEKSHKNKENQKPKMDFEVHYTNHLNHPDISVSSLMKQNSLDLPSQTFDSLDVHNYNFNFRLPSPPTNLKGNSTIDLFSSNTMVNRKATFDIVTRPIIVLNSPSDQQDSMDYDSLENVVDNVDLTPDNTFHVRLDSESFCFTPDVRHNTTTKVEVKFDKSLKPNNSFELKIDSSEFKFTPSNSLKNNSDYILSNKSTPINNTYEISEVNTASTFVKDAAITPEQPKRSDSFYLHQNSFLNNCASISPIPKGNSHNGSVSSQINVSTSTQNNYEFYYSGKEAKNVIEANLWSEDQQNTVNGSTFTVSPKNMKVLSCIQEETSENYISPQKRTHRTPLREKFSDNRFQTCKTSPKYFEISPNFNKIATKRKSTLVTNADSLTNISQPVPKKIHSDLTQSWQKVDVQKLKKISLRTSTKIKEKSVRLHDPDEIIYKFMNPDPFCASTTQDPFLSTLLYYDDKWLHKQEIEFKKWLNALLTPHAELDCKTDNCKVDVVKIWEESRNTESVVHAPTKEVVSSLYHTNNRLNSLRKKAIAFFNSPEMTSVFSKVMSIIERKKITIRDDKDLHLDLGLQAEIMQLLLCYNPLWLRIGLESVYGETIPLKSNSDVIGLSTFLMLRFFTDPYLKQKHSIPHVRNAYLPTFAPAIKKFTLKKFLMLVYFLDQAKLKKLIPHDPCLFCTNSPVKESKKILLEFSRELIAGIGDITKYLKVAGYVLTYKQAPIDEFQYAVKNLGTDLRDGVRLTRVMEVILMRNDLTKLMRIPAISRLQKIHNVKVALTALQEAGFQLQGNIEAKDIVEGHREKTLSLLWQIIYKFRAPIFNKAATTIQHWWRSLKIVIARRIRQKILLERQTKAAIVIQRHWRAYLLKQKERTKYIKIQKSVRIIQNWFRATLAMRKQRAEYLKQLEILQKIKRTNAAITIQTYYRSYRVMKKQRQEYLKIIYAARCIQNRYRSSVLMRQLRAEYLKKRQAAILIQRRWRATLQMKPVRNMFLLIITSIRKIQSYYRSYRLIKPERSRYLKLKQSTIVIQRYWRATLLMRRTRDDYLLFHKSVNTIQRYFRSYLCMKHQREQYLKFRQSVITVQRKWRATILMRKQRKQFLQIKQAVYTLQSYIRSYLQATSQREKAANIIQTRWRAFLLMREQRADFLKRRNAARIIQNHFRAYRLMKYQRNEFLKLKENVKVIQIRWRAILLMRSQQNHYITMKREIASAKKIQTYFRAYRLMKQQRNEYMNLKQAVTVIQTHWKATLLMRRARKNYLLIQKSVLIIQRYFLSYLYMKHQRKQYLELRRSTLIIQRKWRAVLLMRKERSHFLRIKQAAYILKTRIRSYIQAKRQREQYLTLQKSVRIIQNRWRAFVLMREQRAHFLQKCSAARSIQRYFRATRQMRYERREFLKLKESAKVIQNRWRATLLMRIQRNHYVTMKMAAQKIQAIWRGYILRKHQTGKIKVIRQRSVEASLNARLENTIRFRFAKILDQILNDEVRTVQCIIFALRSLVLLTKIYPAICVEYCESLVEKIFIILESSNRSIPHIEACIECVYVLINFITYTGTKMQLLNIIDDEKIESLLNLMTIWADKEGPLFPSLCTFIWILCHYDEKKQQIKAIPKYKEIMTKIYLKTKRKQSMLEHKNNSHRKSIVYDYNLPTVTLNWWKNNSKHSITFTHPLFAVENVLKILDISIH